MTDTEHTATDTGARAEPGGGGEAPVLTGLQVPWWGLLIAGVVWLVFGMVVLQFNLTSARAIALAAGLLLIVASFSQLVTAQAAREWRWVHLVLAALFFVGGIIALVWPDPTFLALTRLVTWFLLFKGAADVIVALAVKAMDSLWWLLLVVGLIEIIVAFWAAGVPSRSAALLVVWVGLIALAKGVTDIVLAFGLRSWRRLSIPERRGAA